MAGARGGVECADRVRAMTPVVVMTNAQKAMRVRCKGRQSLGGGGGGTAYGLLLYNVCLLPFQPDFVHIMNNALYDNVYICCMVSLR